MIKLVSLVLGLAALAVLVVAVAIVVGTLARFAARLWRKER